MKLFINNIHLTLLMTQIANRLEYLKSRDYVRHFKQEYFSLYGKEVPLLLFESESYLVYLSSEPKIYFMKKISQ